MFAFSIRWPTNDKVKHFEKVSLAAKKYYWEIFSEFRWRACSGEVTLVWRFLHTCSSLIPYTLDYVDTEIQWVQFLRSWRPKAGWNETWLFKHFWVILVLCNFQSWILCWKVERLFLKNLYMTNVVYRQLPKNNFW